MTQSFCKWITSDNKLMNLCEIRFFHIVWGVSKGTRDNYHGYRDGSFGENNVLCLKYIDMYEFRGVEGGTYIFHRTFFVYS